MISGIISIAYYSSQLFQRMAPRTEYIPYQFLCISFCVDSAKERQLGVNFKLHWADTFSDSLQISSQNISGLQWKHKLELEGFWWMCFTTIRLSFIARKKLLFHFMLTSYTADILECKDMLSVKGCTRGSSLRHKGLISKSCFSSNRIAKKEPLWNVIGCYSKRNIFDLKRHRSSHGVLPKHIQGLCSHLEKLD